MTDREAAERYRWFITTGYRNPVLNDPKVIHDDATPEYIDMLIVRGMKRWPTRREPTPPEPNFPRVA